MSHRLASPRLACVLFMALGVTSTVHAQGSAVAPTPAQLKPMVDQTYAQLLAAPAVKQLLEAVKADHARSIEDLRMLTEKVEHSGTVAFDILEFAGDDGDDPDDDGSDPPADVPGQAPAPTPCSS